MDDKKRDKFNDPGTTPGQAEGSVEDVTGEESERERVNPPRPSQAEGGEEDSHS